MSLSVQGSVSPPPQPPACVSMGELVPHEFLTKFGNGSYKTMQPHSADMGRVALPVVDFENQPPLTPVFVKSSVDQVKITCGDEYAYVDRETGRFLSGQRLRGSIFSSIIQFDAKTIPETIKSISINYLGYWNKFSQYVERNRESVS